MKNKMLSSLLVLTLICCCSGLLLAATNALTAPTIEAAEKEAEAAALRAVMPDTEDFQLLSPLPSQLPATVKAIFRGENGYVFRLETAGFSTGLVIVCGISDEGRITGVKTVSCNETDGYGKLCETEAYTDQYKNADETLSGVDGISGATKTSKAYRNAIADAFTALHVLGGDR